MEVKDIDKYFSFEILRRGYNYYKKGKVKEIIKLKDGFLGKVKGTDEYQVLIKINDDNYEMNCTCPYAKDDNCKHMAAVLYCLKNNDLPVKKSVQIESKEINDFEKFINEFQKECHKQFHNRHYIYEDELDDYSDIVNKFILETSKYAKSNIKLAYKIFEFFIKEIDSIDVIDIYGVKEDLFDNLFESFKLIFNDKKIFAKFLKFIDYIFTEKSNYYFSHKENIINLLYQYIEVDWQAKDALVILNEINNKMSYYDYYKTFIQKTIVYLNYYFVSERKGLKIAEQYLEVSEICDFLLNKYGNNQDKQIDILEKIINNEKNYLNEEYYDKLLNIYKQIDLEKYLNLLEKKLLKYPDMNNYHELKNNFSKEEWLKIRDKYLNKIKNNRIYLDICIEEKMYDEVLEKLKDEWIETLNKYLPKIVKHKPKETLELYKNKLIQEIRMATDRPRYQKILTNFNYMLQIPNGKEELVNVIKYIREKYKNRRALQEEIDFYEQTYM